MVNLKEDFKGWLIKEGYQSKGVSGNNSTTYDYLRYIDKMLKLLYGHEDWKVLIREFPSVLFFYLLTNKSKSRQNPASFDEINQLPRHKFDFYSTPDLLEKFKFYKEKEMYFSQRLKNINENKKTGTAVAKFYQFLFETKEISDYSYEAYRAFAKKIIDACSQINKVTTVFDSNTALKQIQAKNRNKDLMVSEVAEFLECSVQNVIRLMKHENIEPSVDGLNHYLKKHYHPSAKSKRENLNVMSVAWYTMEDAADRLMCSKTTIKRLMDDGYLGYTDYTPRKIKILAADVDSLIGLDIRKNHII